MKRIALLMALLIFVFSLAACGEQTDDPQNNTTGTVGQSETVSEVTESTCDHQYVEELVSESTCVEKGLMLYTCTECEHTDTEEIPSYGHEGTGASCVEASVCTRCGEVVEDAWGHVDENGVCKNCGIDIVNAEIPVSTEATQATEATEATEAAE